MCWLSGSLTCRIPNVMRSPSARRSLVSSVTVDWFLAPRKRGFNLKSKPTIYPDHGHHGDPPPTRKIPMVTPGIKPGTSWLIVRSSDHQTTRLVLFYMKSIIFQPTPTPVAIPPPVVTIGQVGYVNIINESTGSYKWESSDKLRAQYSLGRLQLSKC
jgi:hypothetical protein